MYVSGMFLQVVSMCSGSGCMQMSNCNRLPNPAYIRMHTLKKLQPQQERYNTFGPFQSLMCIITQLLKLLNHLAHQLRQFFLHLVDDPKMLQGSALPHTVASKCKLNSRCRSQFQIFNSTNQRDYSMRCFTVVMKIVTDTDTSQTGIHFVFDFTTGT